MTAIRAAGVLAMGPRDAGFPREAVELAAAERDSADLHLHSSDEVIGYYIEATDGASAISTTFCSTSDPGRSATPSSIRATGCRAGWC